jgi:hypothetical protein
MLASVTNSDALTGDFFVSYPPPLRGLHMDQPVVSSEQLRELMETAIADAYAEPAFFKALLAATVYVYVPKSAPTNGKLQFIQLARPDNGELVLPLFTDAAKAEIGAAGRWGVISMPGRHLFELTRGTTLVVNPNDMRAVLYPTEVEALLAGLDLAAFAIGAFSPTALITFSAPTPLAMDLLAMTLASHLASESGAEAAYVAEMHGGTDRADVALLVEIIAADERAVRLVQTTAQILQPFVASFPMPIRLACRRRENAFLAGHCEARRLFPLPGQSNPRRGTHEQREE